MSEWRVINTKFLPQMFYALCEINLLILISDFCYRSHDSIRSAGTCCSDGRAAGMRALVTVRLVLL